MVQALSAAGDIDGDGYPDLAFSVDWQSSSMVHNHQLYAWSGGTSISITTPAKTLALNVNTIR